MFRQTSLEINLYYARQAIEYVQDALWHGSVNKKTDQEKPNHAELCKLLGRVRGQAKEIQSKLVSEKPDLSPALFFYTLVPRLTDLYMDNGVGNCYEQMLVALRFLSALGVEDIDCSHIPHQEEFENDHSHLILGGIVFCELWDRMAFPVSDFELYQADSESVEYADFVHTVAKMKDKSRPGPFLRGKPRTTHTMGLDCPPSAVDGKFMREIKPAPVSGSGKTLEFSLLRFSFVTNLNKAEIPESKKPQLGLSRELMYDSGEIIEARLNRLL
jgi:hypothetical protein